MKRIILILGLLATMAGCQSFSIPIFGGSGMSDTDQIASILDTVEFGVETAKIDRVLAHISPNYHDAEGRDYAALRDYLAFLRHNYRRVQITRAKPRISVTGDKAQALEAFGTLAESSDESVAPNINLQGQMVVQFARENGEWMITEWGQIQ